MYNISGVCLSLFEQIIQVILWVMTNLLYEPYKRHLPEKWSQSCVMHFCVLVEPTKLDAFA